MNHLRPSTFVDPGAARLLDAVPAPRRALFLDRDGVINVDHAYVYKREDTEWVPGIFKLCQIARDAAYVLVVVTNQAGIARGLYDEGQFLEYTRWMHAEFDRRGVPLLATWYCPHHPEFGSDCTCRKPRPGMLLGAAKDYHLDMSRSMLIGDKDGDVQAAHSAGVTSALKVGSGRLDDAIVWLQHVTQQEPQGI